MFFLYNFIDLITRLLIFIYILWYLCVFYLFLQAFFFRIKFNRTSSFFGIIFDRLSLAILIFFLKFWILRDYYRLSILQVKNFIFLVWYEPNIKWYQRLIFFFKGLYLVDVFANLFILIFIIQPSFYLKVFLITCLYSSIIHMIFSKKLNNGLSKSYNFSVHAELWVILKKEINKDVSI